MAALVGAPVALGLEVAAAAAVVAAALCGAARGLVARPDDPVALVAGAILMSVLAGVAVASVPLALAVSILVALVVALLALLSLRRDAATAPPWVGAAMAVGLAAVVIDASLLGTTGSVGALALVTASVAASAVGPAIERWGRPSSTKASAAVADALVGAALVAATLATSSADAASAAVAAAALVTGLAALRPSRRTLWIASIAASVSLVWMRLAVAEVDLVEAYTLPLAAALLAVGLVAGRGVDRSSWERVGAGLVAALGPTTYLALTGVDLTRTVAVVIAAMGVTLWGALGREQAPLVVGGTVVAAVALRHLAPVAAQLPRWSVLAFAGVVLLAAGATFEQRRRDLRTARDAFSELR